MSKKLFYRRAAFVNRVAVIALLILTSTASLGFANEKSEKSSSGLGIWGTIKFLPMALLWAGVEAMNDLTPRKPHRKVPLSEIGFSVSEVSFSPDGNELLFRYTAPWQRRVFAIWDIEKETLEKLPDIREEANWRRPSFSPDGSAIIFEDSLGIDQSFVAVMKRDGTEFRRLVPKDGKPRRGILRPTFSPDGKRIIYLRHNSWVRSAGYGAAYQLDLETGVETRLTPWGFSANRVQFLPDGRNFVVSGHFGGFFASDRAKDKQHYPYRSIDLNEEISEANWFKRLAEIRERDEALRIAYRNKYELNFIFIMGPDYGYEPKPAFTQGSSSHSSSISSDGSKIAFLSRMLDPRSWGHSKFSTEVFVRSKGENRQLTQMHGMAYEPVLSPDGKLVFFRLRSCRFAGNTFWIMNSDGSNLREIQFPNQPRDRPKDHRKNCREPLVKEGTENFQGAP